MSPDEITMRDLMDASLRAIDASIYALREQVVSGQQASAREHAQVQAALDEVRSQLGRVPTDEEFVRFKQDAYSRIRALEDDMHQRAGSAKARASMWMLVVGGSSVMGVIAGLVITLIRSFIPAA